ncbi:hypothetical protein ACIBG4_16250 [Nonomuraea sp. NPDC050383]|uniref:hypothetical protein n=1 Tax=Nonomuraea sp. NPDC050383 TaxID=3364362 RepID=UPI0037915B30
MSAAEGLTGHYDDLQSRWTVTDRIADYARLVVPTGNSSEAIHRWFHLKEAYSHQLLERLFKDSNWTPHQHLAILDPFCGSGTTVVSALALAQQYSVVPNILGVERNPFLWEVSTAKALGVLQGAKLAQDIRTQLPLLDKLYIEALKKKWTTPSSTLSNGKYFPPEHLQALLALRHSISELDTHGVTRILRVCLAASVEAAGKLRRDGRALRHKPKWKPQDPKSVFDANVTRVLEDLEGRSQAAQSWKCRVVLGDAREAQTYAGKQKFDWIIFSPPYPNNIDYTEVYKTEAWALGLWERPDEMRAQRLSTIRSHPSVRFPEEYSYLAGRHADEVRSLLSPLIAAIPNDQYKVGRRQIIQGYADDMLRVFSSSRKVINPNGRLVYVVGNSVHGSMDSAFVIAADILLARLAELAGWEVEEIRLARRLTRRSFIADHLRESVVVLRPC